jgi:hypothetical protein
MKWFKERGIEPALGHDGEDHFLEFDIPSEWPPKKVKDFNRELAGKLGERPR